MWAHTIVAHYHFYLLLVLWFNHRVGLSLKFKILKIKCHVNARHSLTGKLLSLMIRLPMNVP